MKGVLYQDHSKGDIVIVEGVWGVLYGLLCLIFCVSHFFGCVQKRPVSDNVWICWGHFLDVLGQFLVCQ